MAKTIKVSEIESLDDATFEMEDDKNAYQFSKPVDPTHPRHYVNNRELYEEMCAYHKKKLECLERGEEIPPLTDKIGRAIIQIATRRCNSWSFAGYSDSWKQEMIGNAIVTVTIRGHNFDPTKSNNPFAYFTQICNNAILEQLKTERRQLYIKYKSIQNANGFVSDTDNVDEISDDFDGMTESDSSSSNPEFAIAYDERMRYIETYEEKLNSKKVSQKKDSSINALEF